MERLWLLGERLGVAMQPVSPLYLFALDDQDLLDLGGERRFEELSSHRDRFRASWQLDENEVMSMVFRLFQAPAPTVHSIRRSLGDVLTRSFDASDVERGLQAHRG